MQPTVLDLPTGRASPSTASSAGPSRTSSFEDVRDAIASNAPPCEFGTQKFGAKGTTGVKEESLNNPLAQLLQIRSDIRNCPAVLPISMRSFPVLTQPVLGVPLNLQRYESGSAAQQ